MPVKSRPRESTPNQSPLKSSYLLKAPEDELGCARTCDCCHSIQQRWLLRSARSRAEILAHDPFDFAKRVTSLSRHNVEDGTSVVAWLLDVVVVVME